MAKVLVKRDCYGLYIRHAGCVFRPLFPVGFDPKNPPTNITEGIEVRARYKGAGASYVKIDIDDQRLFWMNHGSYIVPDGDEIKHRKSYECIIESSVQVI